jgi:hypothetical protein
MVIFHSFLYVYQRVVVIQTNKHHWGLYLGPPHATGAGRSWWESLEKINRSSRGFSRCLGKAIYTLNYMGYTNLMVKSNDFFNVWYICMSISIYIYVHIWTKGIHQFNPDDMWIIAQRGEPPFFFLTALFSFIYPVPTRVLGRPWSCGLDHSCLTVPPSRCHFHGLLVDFFTHMFQFELKAAEKLWISSGLQADGSYQMCG